jgi:hypothetical protein
MLNEGNKFTILICVREKFCDPILFRFRYGTLRRKCTVPTVPVLQHCPGMLASLLIKSFKNPGCACSSYTIPVLFQEPISTPSARRRACTPSERTDTSSYPRNACPFFFLRLSVFSCPLPFCYSLVS